MPCVIDVYEDLFPSADPGGILSYDGYSETYPGAPGAGGTTPPSNLYAPIDVSGWIAGFYYFTLSGGEGDCYTEVTSILQIMDPPICEATPITIRVCEATDSAQVIVGDASEDVALEDIIDADAPFLSVLGAATTVLTPLNCGEVETFTITGWTTENDTSGAPSYESWLDSLVGDYTDTDTLDLTALDLTAYGYHVFHVEIQTEAQGEFDSDCEDCTVNELYDVVIESSCTDIGCDDVEPFPTTFRNRRTCPGCIVNLRDEFFDGLPGDITVTDWVATYPPAPSPLPLGPVDDVIDTTGFPPGTLHFAIIAGEGLDCEETGVATIYIHSTCELPTLNVDVCVDTGCVHGEPSAIYVNGVLQPSEHFINLLDQFPPCVVHTLTHQIISVSNTDVAIATSNDGTWYSLSSVATEWCIYPEAFPFTLVGRYTFDESDDLIWTGGCAGDCIHNYYTVIVNVLENCDPPDEPCPNPGIPSKTAMCV